MLKDLGEAKGHCKNTDGMSCERVHALFNRKIGLFSILHAFGIGNVTAGTDDGDFSSPKHFHNRKDGAVDISLGIPVAGNQKQVLANVDA